ncbi:methionyl-tRNA formyltransferase [Clostridium polynesiense]|uniref:methionyl-tRNA formyltransferase n=1 Tax=Clostridium polynesiense TaxID=1325933 RepID=UPI00058BD1DF|nr:formyltransferase family protein [Clostridium polynesiense]
MKGILVGSVISSQIMLEEMIETGFPIDMVFSLDEKYSDNVSGYYPIHETAKKHNIPYKKFKKISTDENIKVIREIRPDYIFVIGLSQLIDKRILNLPKKGCVGFHPTPLPKFRGRAAMVWQVLLEVHETKCSLFMIDEGIDSGDILGQEEYIIEKTDYAKDVEKKLCVALRSLSKKVLKGLMQNSIVPQKQNEEDATYLLIRRPEDGRIDWKEPIYNIHRLIRAVSHPYPGAFGMYDNLHQIIIWRAEVVENKNVIGIPGQICHIEENYFDVLGTDAILRVTEWENVDQIKMFVGHKLR